ncbi:MAG: PilZ domain-containing protein [Planctomycetes bacterium]|nr:PilZ domain-containing protein [Planctomycetota bacterium]
MPEILLSFLETQKKRVDKAVANLNAFLIGIEDEGGTGPQDRAHERYERPQLRVGYKLEKDGKNAKSEAASILDVSAGGMKMKTISNRGLEKGQAIRFAIFTPGNEEVMSGTGQILRIEPTEDGCFASGIQFDQVKKG